MDALLSLGMLMLFLIVAPVVAFSALLVIALFIGWCRVVVEFFERL